MGGLTRRDAIPSLAPGARQRVLGRSAGGLPPEELDIAAHGGEPWWQRLVRFRGSFLIEQLPPLEGRAVALESHGGVIL